jgi:molybdenum cofactor cytidylyltransferase
MGSYNNFETVLIAAGLSKRMGETNKLFIDIDGEPLIRRAASLYCRLGMQVIVVIGYEADAVRQALLDLPVQTVFNSNFKAGQQGSIRAGLEASNFSKDGIFIALADQPFLMSTDISGFCEAYLDGTRAQIMVPYFGQVRGNPVLFPPDLAKLAHAADDVPNYRRFIDSHPSLVTRYNAPNAHFTTDIDTIEDVRKYL